MARKPSAKVVLNRAALSELDLAIATGVEELVRTVIETAEPPDATPFGEGLVTEGGWAVYAGSKKVGGGSLAGPQPRKPRGLKLASDAITGIAGFGFPARFQEVGTVHQPSRPFLWPTAARVGRIAGDVMREIVGPLLRSKP